MRKSSSLIAACCLLLTFSFSLSASALEKKYEDVVEALKIGCGDSRVYDILGKSFTIRVHPSYSEDKKLWIIELVDDFHGEVGMAAVSLETREVIVFEYNYELMEQTGDDSEAREHPQSLLDLLFQSAPEIEGTNLAWFSFLLTVVFAGNLQFFFLSVT